MDLDALANDAVSVLEGVASTLTSIADDAVQLVEDNPPSVWTLVVLVVCIAISSAGTIFARYGRVHREASARVVIVSVALLLATLDGATLRWTLAVPGLWLMATGAVALWGGIFYDGIVRPRQVALIWMTPPLIAELGSTRSTDRVAILLLLAGLACLGGNVLHLATAILAALPTLWAFARYEIALRKSGEASKYAPVIWRPATSAVLIAGLALAGITGAMFDGGFAWVDASSSSTQGSLVLQALLAIEVGVASLSGAAIGLGVQLRSSSFGADIALAQLRKYRLLASFTILIMIIVGTVLMLGHWDEAAGSGDVLPSSVVHLGILGSLWVVSEAVIALFDLARIRTVTESVSRSTLNNTWSDDLRVYSANAHRRNYGPSRWSEPPHSVHLLIQGIQGAIRSGNLELLEDIVMSWVSLAETQPVLRRFDPFAPTPHELERIHLAMDLDWKEADCLDGLDLALQLVVRNTAAIPGAGIHHIRAIMPLANLTYPPFSSSRRYHELPGFDPDVPGFRTLNELTNAAVNQRDYSAASWLLHRYWWNRGRLAIHWAERLTPHDEMNGRYPKLPLAEHLFSMVAAYASMPDSRGRNTIRQDVLGVIVDWVVAADSRAAIQEGLSNVYRVMTDANDVLRLPWSSLEKVAEKKWTSTGWLLNIIEAAALTVTSGDERNRWASWDLKDFLGCSAAVSRRLAELSSDERDQAYEEYPPFDEERRQRNEQRLSAAVWSVVRLEAEREVSAEWKQSRLPFGSVDLYLREFLMGCSESVGWKVADLVWDWCADQPSDRAMLARRIDGPWLWKSVIRY